MQLSSVFSLDQSISAIRTGEIGQACKVVQIYVVAKILIIVPIKLFIDAGVGLTSAGIEINANQDKSYEK